MRPKRLWTVVVLGFGLLATTPNRILAGFPSFLEGTSTSSRTAAHLDENVEPNAQNFPPQVYNFMQLPPEQDAVTTGGHSLHGGGYPPQHVVMPLHQYHHSLYTAQLAAQNSQPREIDFMSGAGTTKGYILHGGGDTTQQVATPLHQYHYLTYPPQLAAQNSQPREILFIRGASNTESHDDYAIHYGSYPMGWHQTLEQAAQQYGSPSQQQLGRADGEGYHAQPATLAWYQGNHPHGLAQRGSQHSEPVQDDLTRVGQEPGLVFRDSRFSQAGGHGGAASSLDWSSSPPMSVEVSPSPSETWPVPHDLEQHDAAATSNPLVHPAAWRSAGHGKQTEPPEDGLAKIQKETEEANRNYGECFQLGYFGRSTIFIQVAKRTVALADEKQQNVVLGLLKDRIRFEFPDEGDMKAFAENMKIFDTTINQEEVTRILRSLKNSIGSLLRQKKAEEWEYVNLSYSAFFFDLGAFRFKCTPIRKGDNMQSDEDMQNFEILGVKRFDSSGVGPHLWIGRVTLPRHFLKKAKGLSTSRLRAKNFNFHDGGVYDVYSRRRRQLKQEQQQGQQEQAINTERSRARKGKQRQE